VELIEEVVDPDLQGLEGVVVDLAVVIMVVVLAVMLVELPTEVLVVAVAVAH